MSMAARREGGVIRSDPEESQFGFGKFGRAARLGDPEQFVELTGGPTGAFDFANETFTVSVWFQELSPSLSSGVLLRRWPPMVGKFESNPTMRFEWTRTVVTSSGPEGLSTEMNSITL